jgi:hypothetical protein
MQSKLKLSEEKGPVHCGLMFYYQFLVSWMREAYFPFAAFNLTSLICSNMNLEGAD